MNFGDAASNLEFIFVFAGTQTSFHIKAGALADIFFGQFGVLAGHHEVMPLGDFGRRIADGLVSGQGEHGELETRLREPDFRVAAHIAEEYYFIDGHCGYQIG